MFTNDFEILAIISALIFYAYKKRKVSFFITLLLIYCVSFVLLEMYVSFRFAPLDYPYNARMYYIVLGFYMISMGILSSIVLTRYTLALFVILMLQGTYNLVVAAAGLVVFDFHIPDPEWIYSLHEWINANIAVIEVTLAWMCAAITTKDNADERRF